MQFDGLLGATLGRRSALLLGVSGVAAFAAMSVKPSLYLLGDSWGAGLHADPKRALGQVAATPAWTHPRSNMLIPSLRPALSTAQPTRISM